jgi:hypothetical protein
VELPENYFDAVSLSNFLKQMKLTHISLTEHLFAAGFTIIKVVPLFLPVSFRSKLPVNKLILNTYFLFPILWRIIGKQFLIIAEK